MADFDQETLFSLEVIVDQLCLHQSVECRVPAVAFRLLDFPTLLIHHVEPELAAAIRSKLLRDHYRPVPAQLNELKDRKTGGFSVRRGKSCLFHVSPNTVVTSLSNAPLYVMVVDLFPETPKLVGSCAVPLSACARNLYSDIVTNGISVPAVQAGKKELDLCNLMDKKLGTILLGYRLLSLGAALLSHIPTRNIIQVRSKEELDQFAHPAVVNDPQSVAEAYIVAEQSTVTERRSENIDVNTILHKAFTDSQTQVDPCSCGSVGTQTTRQRSYKDKSRTLLANNADDIITTNTVCPPPLFYNSVTCKKTEFWHRQEWSSLWEMANEISGWSDDGTIRVEDKYLDADEKAVCNMDSSSYIVKDSYPAVLAEGKNRAKRDPVTRTPYPSSNMTGFPVLSALMAEILRFQGMNLVPDSGVDAGLEARYTVHKMEKGAKLQKRESLKVIEPKQSAYKCADVLPCNKGLIVAKQRSSGHPRRQKPYFAGMTNTQRLRLAKVNPKLLQELEAKEMQRKTEFRAARVSSVRRKENVPTNSQQNVVETDTFERININRAMEFGDESRESTARYKCPVPTPRTSKMHAVSDGNAPGFGTTGYTRLESHLSLQSSSDENFQFASPLMEHNNKNDRSIHYDNSAVTSASTSAVLNLATRQVVTNLKKNTVGCNDSDTGPVDNFGQTGLVLSPVVLRNASASSVQLEATVAAGVLSVEDLGLQKIVDHYSDESDDNGTDAGINNDEKSKDTDIEHDSVEVEVAQKLSKDEGKSEEPALLRKIVNQYSQFSNNEQSDLEYEYDFEDTPGLSVKSVSTMNSSTSSIVDSSLPQRVMSPVRSQGHEAVANMKDLKLSNSQPVSRMGESLRHTTSVMSLDRSASVAGETYSDAFDTVSEDELDNAKPVTEARPLPSSQLGYTWA